MVCGRLKSSVLSDIVKYWGHEDREADILCHKVLIDDWCITLFFTSWMHSILSKVKGNMSLITLFWDTYA